MRQKGGVPPSEISIRLVPLARVVGPSVPADPVYDSVMLPPLILEMVIALPLTALVGSVTVIPLLRTRMLVPALLAEVSAVDVVITCCPVLCRPIATLAPPTVRVPPAIVTSPVEVIRIRSVAVVPVVKIILLASL